MRQVGWVGVVLVAMSAGAQAPSPQLAGVLKQMDAASAKFERATADFQWDYYEKIVRDTTTQKGSIYFEREKGSTNMGAVIVDPAVMEKGKPKLLKVIQYEGGTVQMFDPGVDQITVLHEDQAEVEGFLTLGFGASGTDLQKAWNVTDLGPETIGDVKAEKLDLIGKSPESRKNFTHVTIWVDPMRAVSLKQIFYQTGGNYRTATYTNVKVNGNLHKDQFAIKKDKNTTTIRH
jgi:outer membrane lipoprotein-sorting protein